MSDTDHLLPFKEKWELDDKCIDFIASLPLEVQATVVEEFFHAPGQTNPSARCMAFAKNVLSSGRYLQGADAQPQLQAHGSFTEGSGSGLTDAEAMAILPEFQGKWGLDDKCVEFLQTLPTDVLSKVFQEFTHSPDQTNPSARCMAFGKGILAKGQGKGGKGPVQQVQYTPAIVHAPAQLEISSETVTLLPDLSAEAQAEVAAAFPLFQTKWGVDDRCMEYLATLQPKVVYTVFSEFSHSPEQTNVSARCMAFAKGIAAKVELQDLDAQYHTQQPQRYESLRSYGGIYDRGDSQLSPALEEKLGSFAATWNLDAKCSEFLANLPPHVLELVIKDFTHRPDQTNVCARCMAFAKNLLMAHPDPPGGKGNAKGGWTKNQGKSSLSNPSLIVAERHASQVRDWRPQWQNQVAEVPADPVGDLLQFQMKWGIDDKCVDFLGALPHNVQKIVTFQFDHHPSQTNVSARCMAFAKQVMQKHGPRGTEAAPHYTTQQAPPGQSFSPQIQQQMQAAGITDNLMNFQAKWGVDDKCMEFLGQMPKHIQDVVCAEFQHSATQTNVSARAMGFARRVLENRSGAAPPIVANSLPNPGGIKRGWEVHPRDMTHDMVHGEVSPQEFSAKWGIDDRAMQIIQSMPDEVQQTVFAEFTHQPGQTNASARAQAFAKAVMQRMSYGQPPQKFQRLS